MSKNEIIAGSFFNYSNLSSNQLTASFPKKDLSILPPLFIWFPTGIPFKNSFASKGEVKLSSGGGEGV